MNKKNIIIIGVMALALLSACGGNNSSYVVPNSSMTTSEFKEEKLNPIVKPRTTAYSKDNMIKISGTLPYRLYVPEDYDGDIYHYPLFIFLHGAGERGKDNSSQLKNAVQNLFDDLDSPIYQSIGIFPQCPPETDTTDKDLNQWVDTPWGNGNYSNDEIPESNDLKAVIDIVNDLKQKYSINEDRIYVMGLSMGGFGAWNLLMNHTNMFAGAIPVCGGADVTYAEKLKNMPIYTIHGTSDTTVPWRGTREMVKALRAAGSRSVIYDELRGFGHNVWDYASTKTGIIDWLFAQNKKNHTDVGNDGIYKYIFEAEAASVKTSNTNNAIRFGNTICYNSGESGMGYLGDYSSVGDEIKFSITSDRAAKATLSLRMGLRKDKDYTLVGTSSTIFSKISHNGDNLNINPDFKFTKSGIDKLDYYIWEEKDIFEVDLVKGENTFSFFTNGQFLHFDYLSLETSANVKWTSEVVSGHNYSDYLLTQTPTNKDPGTMYRYCKTCATKEEVYIEKDLNDCSPKVERTVSEYLGSITSYDYNGYQFNILSNPTGTLKDNIIQAEAATINGNWHDTKIVNIYNTPVKHLQLNSRKGQLVYKFNSSEEATVDLFFSLAPHKQYNLMLADSLRITLNGKPYALNDINSVNLDSGSWHNFKDVNIGLVDVKKGENTLVIDVLGNFNFNFDFMNFKSVATIA